jgi:hypothetical protein
VGEGLRSKSGLVGERVGGGALWWAGGVPGGMGPTEPPRVSQVARGMVMVAPSQEACRVAPRSPKRTGSKPIGGATGKRRPRGLSQNGLSQNGLPLRKIGSERSTPQQRDRGWRLLLLAPKLLFRQPPEGAGRHVLLQ